MRYINTGAWTHEQLTYAAVDEHGARLGEYVPASRDASITDIEMEPEQQTDASGESLTPAC